MIVGTLLILSIAVTLVFLAPSSRACTSVSASGSLPAPAANGGMPGSEHKQLAATKSSQTFKFEWNLCSFGNRAG